MSLEYRITWDGVAGKTMEELYDDDAEAILRIADLKTQNAPNINTEARPVGRWAPATPGTITTSRERASAALMASGRTQWQRDFIRASMKGPANNETVTFEVDSAASIVLLLYPELAA